MQSRFEIATVLYFTATLSIGCACGLETRQDVALGNLAAAASEGALVATETGHLRDNDSLRRAAVFRDYGRYYK